MIRQQAFSEKRKMLKGGLHCHTTRSDGQDSPEDTIRYYKKNGYDFLALTDHRLYNYKNFAPETGITVIPGMEFNNHQVANISGIRTFHTVCLGYLKEDGNDYNQDEYYPSVRADMTAMLPSHIFRKPCLAATCWTEMRSAANAAHRRCSTSQS